jgi:hypothetical protein
MADRDEFTEATKQTLAKRAAYFCSNPSCLKLTAGPSKEEDKSLTTGHAAHIHAASPNGPRYDPNQTKAQRKAITNGLWLCRECGDIVDKDSSSHTPEQLVSWKESHTKLISEVRTQGYAKSLALLQSGRLEPVAVKKILAQFEDKRVLWTAFDYEVPRHVRASLDVLRVELVKLRAELMDESPLDAMLLALTQTIHKFFDSLQDVDLDELRFGDSDPNWARFRDALAALRKSIGLQIAHITKAHGIKLSEKLKSMLPAPISP